MTFYDHKILKDMILRQLRTEASAAFIDKASKMSKALWELINGESALKDFTKNTP